ncbi:hypothetical protein [Streptomyces sp. NPDC046860]|uniref:hypothetical protein n=1 Tax=Streptomyces sp. NPDC046860 TaxID=3154495 RepID=UPI0033FAD4CD
MAYIGWAVPVTEAGVVGVGVTTRTWLLLGAAAGAVLWAGGPAQAAPGPQDRADLAFHGWAVIDGDRMDVRLTPRDHGPSAVPEASVRVRWSVPPAGAVTLPQGCTRTGERTVVCGTGALAAGEAGQEIRLSVRLRVPAPEVTLEVETAWNGGVADPDRSNDRLRVLVLPTGDEYSF